jgi:phytoene dehydrogenase-like protein
MHPRLPDAIVVGTGPNGLAAALTLARAGQEVLLLEGASTAGGGCRTAELTLPGFHHDVCSAVHPMIGASPFFRQAALPLTLLEPEVQVAHPLDGGRAAAVYRSVRVTADVLGEDAVTYRRLFAPLARDSDQIMPTFLSPLRSVPRHPLAALRLAGPGLLPAAALARAFRTAQGRALLAGAAAHSMLPLSHPLTGAFGLMLLTLAHSTGWPVVEGGSGRIADALIAEIGSTVHTDRWIRSLDDLPRAGITMLDLSADQVAQLTAARSRFRFGPGVCKVDWALDGPVPWTAEVCRRTCTVHVGGSFEEVARAEHDVGRGRHADQPFCIVAQPGVVDPSRAPAGHQTLWGYCHVPAGSDVDVTDRIEAQIERFAPGFRDRILARTTKTAEQMHAANANYVRGDINGGAATLWQTVFRPTIRWNPYRTRRPGVYICSASTPPGGGVHGMCGLLAAQSALRDVGRA